MLIRPMIVVALAGAALASSSEATEVPETRNWCGQALPANCSAPLGDLALICITVCPEVTAFVCWSDIGLICHSEPD